MNSLNSSNNLLIEQPIDGYRYSIEPFLIADFAKLYSEYRLLDIGTGCGIIPLLITTQIELKEIVGIEIQKSLYDFAVNNISNNDLSQKVRLIHGDFIKATINEKNQPFDIIVSNPPYRKLNTGRINPKHEKAIARHELSITLEALIKKAGKLLKHRGTFCMAYPPTRLNEVQEKLHSHKLFPSRIRFIHGSSDAEARIFLIEAVKEHQVDCIIEPPLFIYNNDGLYSEKMGKIYDSFNYHSWADHIKEK